MAQSRPTSWYFGYGSNMWRDQMVRRCPESTFLGIARVEGWKWLIVERGYANIVKSPGDHVYGLVYDITEADEGFLDGYEGVPHNYTKEYISVTFLGKNGSPERREVQVLVYIDFLRTDEGKAPEEYIYRLNRAFDDAVNEGVPEKYFDTYARRFIPKDLLGK